MKLRTLLKRGALRAVKNAEGVYEFDAADLDALRAMPAPAALLPKYPTASVPGAATASAAPAPATGAVVASPTASAPQAAPPIALAPVTAGWTLAATPAVHGSAQVDAEDEDDVGEPAHQPPFWTTAIGVEPAYPSGVPRVDPATLRIFYTPEAVTAPHASDSAGAVQLHAQVVDLRAQLAATTTAWRHQRVTAIAAEIAAEALMSGTLPQVAMAARDAAHAAAAALTDDELRREDGYPQAVARGAGMAAAQQFGAAIAWQAQQSPWPSSPPSDPHDEIARARARRRARSPRW
jgi:hypothetical protein